MKTTKNTTTRFTLRVPATVKKALAKKAKQEGRSINAQAIQLLQESLRQ